MKHKIIKFLFLLFFVVPVAAQDKNPTILDVARKFYSTYDLRYAEYSYAQFDKVRNDWYVRPLRIKGKELEPGERIPFYDGSKKVFLEINEFEKRDSLITVDPRDYVQEYDEYNYNIQPFYGYRGWYNDVIKHYEAYGDMSQDEIYCLARAYGAKASVVSSNQSLDGLPSETFTFPLGRNSFSQSQREAFLSYSDKAISNYKLLATINPGFETRVGSARLKHANEEVYRFHILRSFDFDFSSNIKLPDNLYDDSTYQWTVNLLNSMPANAIFLSYGDNDFYPLVYAQFKGIRKDVHIINYSLLAVDRFIYLNTFKWFEATPVAIKADTSTYIGIHNDFILVNKSDNSISLDEFMKMIEQKNVKEDPVSITAGTILLKKGQKQIPVSLENTSYLFKNHWILMDILNNLDGRPLVMLNETFDFPGLVPYLRKSGELFTWQP